MEKKEYRKTANLKLWDKNPRSIKEKDFDRLKKQCVCCEKQFEPYRPNHKYCSVECKEKGRRKTLKRKKYMRDYMRGYHKTERGKENIQRKNKKWEGLKSGKDFRKNRKANIRGARGRYSVEYFEWLSQKTGCISCGKRDDLEVDHIVPISVGGQNLDWNIQPLCRNCNAQKSNKLLVSHMDNYVIDMCYATWLLEQR